MRYPTLLVPECFSAAEMSQSCFRLTLLIVLMSLFVVMGMGFCLPSTQVHAQEEPLVRLDFPQPEGILRGSVQILGAVSSGAFHDAEVDFSYLGDPSSTWFVIAELAEPPSGDLLGTWDTTSISDGDYLLRLRLRTLDGTIEDAVVSVQVRNYTSPRFPTPSPTGTPRGVIQVETPMVIEPTLPSSRPGLPTPTPLSANEAALTRAAVIGGVYRGALAVLALCIIVGTLFLRRRP